MAWMCRGCIIRIVEVCCLSFFYGGLVVVWWGVLGWVLEAIRRAGAEATAGTAAAKDASRTTANHGAAELCSRVRQDSKICS